MVTHTVAQLVHALNVLSADAEEHWGDYPVSCEVASSRGGTTRRNKMKTLIGAALAVLLAFPAFSQDLLRRA